MVQIKLQNLDCQCKKQCNQNAQCSELKKHLKEGVNEIKKPFEGIRNQYLVKDKSLIFNTDLMETLEFDNLNSTSNYDYGVCLSKERKSRRAC